MLITKLEAILFAIAKPIAISQLKKQLEISDEVILEAITEIKTRFNTPRSGIHVLEHEGKVQFVTNPDVGTDVSGFLRKEAQGPLTRPSLETLAVIAYRGPVTKPEIEHVRGVNCSLILRNLLIRGLIEEEEDKQRLQFIYRVSTEFLKELGLHKMEELPNFRAFQADEKMNELFSSFEQTQTDL